MTEEGIAEVGIDEGGRLYVRPAERRFPEIYRAAMEVGWDSERGRLFAPRPREWSHARWFGQILAACAQEYGVRLKLGEETVWTEVPDAVRSEILGSQD